MRTLIIVLCVCVSVLSAGFEDVGGGMYSYAGDVFQTEVFALGGASLGVHDVRVDGLYSVGTDDALAVEFYWDNVGVFEALGTNYIDDAPVDAWFEGDWHSAYDDVVDETIRADIESATVQEVTWVSGVGVTVWGVYGDADGDGFSNLVDEYYGPGAYPNGGILQYYSDNVIAFPWAGTVVEVIAALVITIGSIFGCVFAFLLLRRGVAWVRSRVR